MVSLPGLREERPPDAPRPPLSPDEQAEKAVERERRRARAEARLRRRRKRKKQQA
jgi:hypothetical protein